MTLCSQVNHVYGERDGQWIEQFLGDNNQVLFEQWIKPNQPSITPASQLMADKGLCTADPVSTQAIVEVPTNQYQRTIQARQSAQMDLGASGELVGLAILLGGGFYLVNNWMEKKLDQQESEELRLEQLRLKTAQIECDSIQDGWNSMGTNLWTNVNTQPTESQPDQEVQGFEPQNEPSENLKTNPSELALNLLKIEPIEKRFDLPFESVNIFDNDQQDYLEACILDCRTQLETLTKGWGVSKGGSNNYQLAKQFYDMVMERIKSEQRADEFVMKNKGVGAYV